MLPDLSDLIIVAGHYGTGKTNLAVNIAKDLALQGKDVVLVDMDIVNPYFRSADFEWVAEKYGFEILAPPYANSNLDMPALSATLDAKLRGDQTLVLDVGGDDAGAVALGRYAPKILSRKYDMLYVINAYRHITGNPKEALEELKPIEAVSRLQATYIVNNSNLGLETTPEHILSGVVFAKEVAKLANLPVLLSTVEEIMINNINKKDDFYPVEVFVKTPWNK